MLADIRVAACVEADVAANSSFAVFVILKFEAAVAVEFDCSANQLVVYSFAQEVLRISIDVLVEFNCAVFSISVLF